MLPGYRAAPLARRLPLRDTPGVYAMRRHAADMLRLCYAVKMLR